MFHFQMPQCSGNCTWSNAVADPWPLLLSWFVGGLLAVVVPVLQWNARKRDFYDAYGYAIEYEQQQRAYEEGNNNNNQNYYYGYPECHWWQYKCRMSQFLYRQNADGNNDNGDYQMEYPGWFVFFGGETEEDQRWREEQGEVLNGESNGATKFVYAWSIVMFCTILFYGAFCFYKKRAVGPLIIMMCMFFQFSILTMVLVCQGMLNSDERDLEDSVYGWYGQMGVLIVYTNNAYFWFCFVFCVVLLARAWWQRYVQKEQELLAEEEQGQLSGSYYKAEDDSGEPPQGQMT